MKKTTEVILHGEIDQKLHNKFAAFHKKNVYQRSVGVLIHLGIKHCFIAFYIYINAIKKTTVIVKYYIIVK